MQGTAEHSTAEQFKVCIGEEKMCPDYLKGNLSTAEWNRLHGLDPKIRVSSVNFACQIYL